MKHLAVIATLTLTLTLILATPAMAGQCPMDMAKINAAMSGATLSDTDMTKVRELRALGEAQHEAGDQTGSVATLAEAKDMLGLN